MELTHEFTVGIPVEEAWKVLTDVERIAPCLPGAQLQETVGDEYHGTVKVKVGPVAAEYKGVATFAEQDPDAYRAVLRAQGREARGGGSARADITATLVPSGDTTTVQVVTDLTISGRVAQFGRGVLGDVSARLLDQFAACLQQTVATAGAAPGSTASGPAPVPEADVPAVGTPASGSEVRAGAGTQAPVAPSAPAASADLDLVRVAGPAVAKRLVPVVVVTAVVWVVVRRARRRSAGRARDGATA